MGWNKLLWSLHPLHSFLYRKIITSWHFGNLFFGSMGLEKSEMIYFIRDRNYPSNLPKYLQPTPTPASPHFTRSVTCALVAFYHYQMQWLEKMRSNGSKADSKSKYRKSKITLCCPGFTSKSWILSKTRQYLASFDMGHYILDWHWTL